MQQGINQWRENQVVQVLDKVTHEELNREQVKDLPQAIRNTEVLLQDKAALKVNNKEDHHQATQATDLQVKADHHKVIRMLHKARDLHHREDSRPAICSVTQIL